MKFKVWFKTSKSEHLWHCKGFENDSYNKTHLMRKKLSGSKPIRKIEKTFIPLNMWNSKILKIQNFSKIDTKF